MKKISFEEIYRGKKDYFGKNPHKLTTKIINYKKTGEVLDIGCGEGGDAIFLAKKGFKVTAIDISETGIKNLLQKAQKEKVKIDAKVKDIVKFEFNKKYDVILCLNILQFLNKKQVYNLIKKMKKNTKKDGLNVIIAFNEKNPFKGFPFLFKKGELKDSYKDWKILVYKEFITPLEKHGKDGKLHRHGISSIITKK